MTETAMQFGAELTSHPMVRRLFDVAVPLITNDAQVSDLTAANSYSLDVFDAMCALLQSFERLGATRSFATLPPSEKYLNGLKINRHDWLEYHISIFYITIVTIGDEAVSLVNNVLHLGIDPRHCRADAVKSNKWVKDTSIPTQLVAIENLIKPHKKQRNSLVHGGKNPSLNSLVKSGNLDQLKGISLALQHSPEAFPETMHSKLDEAYVRAFFQINKSLDTETSQLRVVIWQLLTDLNSFYDKWNLILSNHVVRDPHTD